VEGGWKRVRIGGRTLQVVEVEHYCGSNQDSDAGRYLVGGGLEVVCSQWPKAAMCVKTALDIETDVAQQRVNPRVADASTASMYVAGRVGSNGGE